MQDIHRLIIALAEKKKTCKWLSEELGVNPSTVNKWCTNSSQTDIETLGKVSKLLCVFFFCTLCLHAQEGLYEQMKAELNEQSLPLVNMTVDVTALNETDFVPGEIEITDYYRRTDPESETVRYPCKYRIRGGISTAYEKKSFAVKLYDDSGKDLDANIFGIREENSWILDAMANDRIRMRNRVCFDLWNEMGLSGAWQRERSRWNDNPVPLQENIYDELDYVKNWYSKNHAYLCAEFKSDITTSIEETARQQTAVAHTLVGHRVDVKSMQKGIYIIDGKKVAVR